MNNENVLSGDCGCTVGTSHMCDLSWGIFIRHLIGTSETQVLYEESCNEIDIRAKAEELLHSYFRVRLFPCVCSAHRWTGFAFIQSFKVIVWCNSNNEVEAADSLQLEYSILFSLLLVFFLYKFVLNSFPAVNFHVAVNGHIMKLIWAFAHRNIFLVSRIYAFLFHSIRKTLRLENSLA